MAAGGNRWWGARSEFPWEQDALDFIRQRMPPAEPYRAWTTFTFTAKSGHVREVDLLMVTPSGLYLVEIKSHQGRLVNSGSTWMFHHHGRVSTIENPLHLTNRKAVELKEQLQWALRKTNTRGLRVPYIQAAVFLSDPALKSELDELQRPGVYARSAENGLPPIWEELLGAGRPAGPSRGEVTFSRKLPELLDAIGIQGYRKHRTVGTWRLEAKAMDAGPTWEDYLAENTAMEGDYRRVRLYLSELGASREAQESTRRAARREYLVLQGIDHPGIVKAEQFSDDHDAGPAIVFPHRPEWLRLDHYMAQYGDGLDVETRLGMIRQLAEALAHAHRRHLYHRALAARSVYVAFHGAGYDPTLKIVDWQAAARPGDALLGRTSTLAGAVATAAGHIERSAEAYLAPEFGRAEAESVPLDVFGLGALGYLIMTGTPPADSRGALAQRLNEEQALTPSAIDESITPQMDEIIECATKRDVFDRFESVKEFLEYLDLVEEELTAPDTEPDPDPLEAVRGTVVNGWTVLRNLGQGSTSRVFLAERETSDGKQTGVLKVALTEAAADRLHDEAALLARLRRSRHIVGLIEGPFDVADRTVVVLEQAGQVTLAEHIKRQGRLSPDELEQFGNDLFEAVDYLEEEGVRHRDIKPENLAIHRLANNTSRLVLLDFSMAGTPDTAVKAGTPDYKDPFVGTDRRPRYDDHAERYSIAVTLHEMAAAERPSWGDGMAEAEFIDKAESTPQISEDRFDAGLRDSLAAFFRRALHRDAEKRFASLKQMWDAWKGMFLDLDQTAPPTTPSSTDEDTEDVKKAREAQAKAAVPATQLVEAGLSPRALSAAVDGLGVSTVGELMVVPAARVHRLAKSGIGSGPRNELLRLASFWRKKHNSKESVAAVAKEQRQTEDVSVAGADVKERLKRLSLDEVAGRLVPKNEGQEADIVALALALPGPDGSRSPLEPWASQREIADFKSVKPTEVSHALTAARRRWTADSAVKPLREDVIAILTEKGRILEAEQLATELLTRRGSGLTDPDARRAVAGAALRVAIETEERLDEPRLAKRRIGPGGKTVLIALRAPEDTDLPDAADLFDYAEELGKRADELAALDPLPSAVTVRGKLREVVVPSGMALLPDTALVALAAAASVNAAVTARLELYPRDLDPVRALELAQIAGYLGGAGIPPADLRRRVLARFPRMTKLPDEPTPLYRALRKAGYEAEWSEDGKRLVDKRFDAAARSYSAGHSPGTSTATGRISTDQITERLLASVDGGGFLALKTRIRHAESMLGVLSVFTDVTPINVTTEFTRALREIVAARGKPTWETMVGADPASAPPVFHQLIEQAFAEVEKTVRAVDRVALLHDATPLARYKGGPELLARLADAARDPHETPNGLWLLCPMADPKSLPLLDDMVVETNTSNERLLLPRHFGQPDETSTGRAS